MSAESAHLSTFGAETETEAEIRSTSNYEVAASYEWYHVDVVATDQKQEAVNDRKC